LKFVILPSKKVVSSAAPGENSMKEKGRPVR